MSPNAVAGILPHLFEAMAYGQKWQTRTLALNVSVTLSLYLYVCCCDMESSLR
jgi:hypothetical protein